MQNSIKVVLGPYLSQNHRKKYVWWGATAGLQAEAEYKDFPMELGRRVVYEALSIILDS